MGARKKLSAGKRKEAMKTVAIATLRNVPTSPRKMRQVADVIRGLEVEKALGILQFSTRHTSLPMRKLLLSAIARPGVSVPIIRIGYRETFIDT